MSRRPTTRDPGWGIAGPPLRPSPRVRRQASEQLRRLLHIIPAAARDEGASLTELADDLDVDVDTVGADLRRLAERAHHHRPGRGEEIQLSMETDRVKLWTSGDLLRRPAKLSRREALCLSLGLRLAHLEDPPGDGAGTDDLRQRLEAGLAMSGAGDVAELLRAPELEDDGEGVRSVVTLAARQHLRCRIRYLKAGATSPTERTVRPYVVVYAEGRWYVVGHCETAGAVRSFRLDRVLDATVDPAGEENGRFEPPEDFDLSAYVDTTSGRVLRADEEIEATVLYSPRVARWLAEREEGEWLDDGSFRVRHRVADPGWLVRHVLRYAGEAEVVEPEAMREEVRRAAGGIGRD